MKQRYIEIFQEKALSIPQRLPTAIIGASVLFYYRDTPNKKEHGYFSFGAYCEERNEDSYGVNDELVFFYCNGQADLDRFMRGGNDDFVVLSYQLEREEMVLEKQNYFQ